MTQKQYDAFISYSHRADRRLAQKLQSGIQSFAKPWYKFRVTHVFLDETDLSVTHEGWNSIEAALMKSRYLIFLASPAAARSKWVSQELKYWIDQGRCNKLLFVLTDGKIVWNDISADFDWEQTTALPKQVLSGHLVSEPIWTDLRSIRDADDLSLRNSAFQASVAKLTAPIRGQDLSTLISEDYQQHRRNIRLVRLTIIILVILFLSVSVTTIYSILQRKEAIAQQNIILAKQLSVNARLEAQNSGEGLLRSALLTVESLRRKSSLDGFIAWEEGAGKLPNGKQVRLYHDGDVGGLAFGHNGNHLASAGYDRSVRLWDLVTRKELFRVKHDNWGHVGSVIFNVEGTRLLTWGNNKKVKVWSAKDGEAIASLPHSSNVFHVNLSWDGRIAATLDQDKIVRTWDVDKQSLLAKFGLKNVVTLMALSPDGLAIAVAMKENLVDLWNPVSGKVITRLETENPITSMTYDSTGRLLFISDEFGNIRGVDVPSGEITINIKSTRAVSTLRINTNMKLILASHEGGGITVWSFEGMEIARIPSDRYSMVKISEDGVWVAVLPQSRDEVQLWRLPETRQLIRIPHGGLINDFEFDPKSKNIATSGNDNSILITPLTGGVATQTFEPNIDIKALSVNKIGSQVSLLSKSGQLRVITTNDLSELPRVNLETDIGHVNFSPKGHYLTNVSEENQGALWALDPLALIFRWAEDNTDLTSIFSPDGKHLLTRTLKGRTLLIDTATGKVISNRLAPLDFIGLMFSSDGKSYLELDEAGEGIIRNVADGKTMGTIKHGGRIDRSFPIPDANFWLTQDTQQDVYVWDQRTLKLKAKLPHELPIELIKYNKERDQLITYTGNRKIRSWKLASANLTASTQLRNPLDAMLFSQESNLLAVSVWRDTVLHLFNASSMLEEKTLVHGGVIQYMDFDDSGMWLATSSSDNYLRIWNTLSGEEVARIAHPKKIEGMMFSENSKTLLTITSNGTTNAWLWKPEDLIREACSRLSRNLSMQEWSQYFSDLPYQETCPNLSTDKITNTTGESPASNQN